MRKFCLALGIGFVYFGSPGIAQAPTNILAPRYRLDHGDQIQVKVFDFDEFSGQYTIPTVGTINLPQIGEVPVVGLTLAEVAKLITERLRPVVKQPMVSVNLAEMRPVVVNVQGEIAKPGPVTLSTLSNLSAPESIFASGNGALPLPLLSVALVRAGGVKTTADLRQVTITRLNGKGGTTTFGVNLWENLVSPQAKRDIDLWDGDTIYVPRAGVAEALSQGPLLARSSLAPATIHLRVMGQVKIPGPVVIAPNNTIAAAIGAAGGATDKADLSQVFFVRLTPEGIPEKVAVDLKNFADNYPLQEGDLVFVPQSGLAYSVSFWESLFGRYVERTPKAKLSQINR